MLDAKETQTQSVVDSILEDLAGLREIVLAFEESQAIIRSPDGRIRFWSRGSERLYGWHRHEAVGAISHQLLETEGPVPISEIMALLERDGVWQGELKYRHKNGHDVYVASHWVLRRQSDGDDTVIEVNNDLTERKQAEQRLRDNEARLRAVMDNAVDGLITIDERGIVTSFSRPAERIFSFCADEVLGRNVNMLMPEPFHGAHDGYLAAYLTTGQAKIIGIGREVSGRRKDGSTFPMDLAIARNPQSVGKSRLRRIGA
jgi:hypothetical protein